MQSAPSIVLTGDVSSFFREVLHQARPAGVEANDAIETYLVSLLVDYAHPDQRYQATLERPITLLLNEASEASGFERFERLRTLGDGVLYVSGFFGEHLERRGVELSYVGALGAQAYSRAGAMLPCASAEQPDLFAELAQRFQAFVGWLAQVADSLLAQGSRGDGAMLRLYERWLRTGSQALAGALVEHGVMPLRGAGGLS